jgi:hypothetical protein
VNAVASILPIEGVSEELLRALNERFRQLSQESTSTTSGSVAGLVFTHANRASANLTAVGTYGTESDRGVVYQVQSVGSSKAWVYISGQFKAAFADRPTDLGSNDTGFLWHVSDYAHLLRWTGTGWEFVDEMGGYFAFRVVAPDGNGWVLCDGTATHYLHITAGVVSEVAITPPNLTGTPAYLKAGAAYAVTINAAVVPATTGPTGVGVTAGSGASSAANNTTHTHAVSLPGDPVSNVVCLPYFRK